MRVDKEVLKIHGVGGKLLAVEALYFEGKDGWSRLSVPVI